MLSDEIWLEIKGEAVAGLQRMRYLGREKGCLLLLPRISADAFMGSREKKTGRLPLKPQTAGS